MELGEPDLWAILRSDLRLLDMQVCVENEMLRQQNAYRVFAYYQV